MNYLDENGRYLFPGELYNAGNYSLICVNTAFIPFFRIFFAEMQDRKRWATREDWWRSYQVIAEMEEMLMTGCVTQLIEEQQRLYRLIDSIFNGAIYTATTNQTTNITTISPDIPAIPSFPQDVEAGLRRQLLDMQGIINAGWFGIGGKPATIADIVNALRVGSAGAKTGLLDTLAAILAAAGDTAEIFHLVESLLADTVETGGEGAIVAVLIASTMAQASAISAQAAQIQRLINAIDGGATPAPTANVVSELADIRTLLG
ncbi:MAG: hypothetical protein HGA65_03425 [Oscillochloris sp.]|nr:hypothetical protein [Oscillochloris sp.]